MPSPAMPQLRSRMNNDSECNTHKRRHCHLQTLQPGHWADFWTASAGARHRHPHTLVTHSVWCVPS